MIDSASEKVKDRLSYIDPSLWVNTLEQMRNEEAICLDFALAGFDVLLIMDLTWKYSDYTSAIPIMIHHMNQKDCDDLTLGYLARLTDTKGGINFWRELVQMFFQVDIKSYPNFAEGLAVALLGLYVKNKKLQGKLFPDIEAILRDASRGYDRAFFLNCINRKKDERTLSLIHDLKDDPQLSPIITKWKKGKAV